MNTHESPQRVGASERSGGPAAAPRVADTTDKFTPCECVEAVIVWAILSGDAPPPNTPGWLALMDFVEAMVQRRLAAIRPVLVHSDMWDSARGPNRYDDLAQLRDTYDRPPKSAAQIRAEVKHSHARWEREIAARWAS